VRDFKVRIREADMEESLFFKAFIWDSRVRSSRFRAWDSEGFRRMVRRS